MPYAILRFQKRKAGSVAACERHNERKKEAYKSNPDIDVERSKNNYHLIPPPRYTYKKEIKRRIAEAGCKVRRDSVMMVETLITASPEFMDSLPPEEQKGGSLVQPTTTKMLASPSMKNRLCLARCCSKRAITSYLRRRMRTNLDA